MKHLLEVCVDSFESAKAAVAVSASSAHRIIAISFFMGCPPCNKNKNKICYLYYTRLYGKRQTEFAGI